MSKVVVPLSSEQIDRLKQGSTFRVETDDGTAVLIGRSDVLTEHLDNLVVVETDGETRVLRADKF